MIPTHVHQLRISLDRFEPSSQRMFCTVSVLTENKWMHTQHIFESPSDFRSRFDEWMDVARDEFKRLIKDTIDAEERSRYIHPSRETAKDENPHS